MYVFFLFTPTIFPFSLHVSKCLFIPLFRPLWIHSFFGSLPLFLLPFFPSLIHLLPHSLSSSFDWIFLSLLPFLCTPFIPSFFFPSVCLSLCLFFPHIFLICHTVWSDISISPPLTLAGRDVWKVTSVAIQIPLDFSPWVQIFSWLPLCCCRYTVRARSVWLKPAVAKVIFGWWISEIHHNTGFTHRPQPPQLSSQISFNPEFFWVPLTP